MNDDAFRKRLFDRLLRISDLRILAETGCTSELEEKQWAQDFKSCGHVFWATPEAAAPTPGHSGRGMVVLVANRVPLTASKVIRDPDGRYIAVRCRIYERESLILGMHADNRNDSEQEAFYDRVLARLIAEGLEEEDCHALDVHVHADCNNVESRRLDYAKSRDEHGRQQATDSDEESKRPRGVAAMQRLQSHLGVCDAFRELHEHSVEFTRYHPSRDEHVSRARLDRSSFSTHLYEGSAPRVLAVKHIWPSSCEIAALRTAGSKSKWSDHAAVLTSVRYSNSKRPKKQWRLPLHLLTNPATADEIRAIIKRGLAASPPSNEKKKNCRKLERLLDEVREWAITTVKRRHNEHVKELHALQRDHERCDQLLGEGIHGKATLDQLGPHGDATRDARERTTRQQKASIEQRLQQLYAAEQAKFMDDNAIEEASRGDTCWKGFFVETKKAHEDNLIRQLRETSSSGRGGRFSSLKSAT